MKYAVVGLATFGAMMNAVYAQSSVTLYGVLDTNIEYARNVAGSASSGDRFSMSTTGGPTGPRWGLRGSERLSENLDAVFTLENGFGVDNGVAQQGGRMFGRQAFVGFRSKQYGTLTFGRQYITSFDMLANFGPLVYGTTYEPLVYQLGTNVRSDNTVKYTNVYGPLSIGAHWSFGNGVAGNNGENPGQFRRDTGYGAGMNYQFGSFNTAIMYDQANPSQFSQTGAVLGSGTNKKAAVAMTYSLSKFTLFAGYRWGQNKNQVGQTVYRDNYYWTGAQYAITPAVVLQLGYYYADVIKNNNTNPSNPWQIGFLANYSLSKRTDIYIGTGYSKNAGLNFDGSYVLATGKDHMMAVALGMKHKF